MFVWTAVPSSAKYVEAFPIAISMCPVSMKPLARGDFRLLRSNLELAPNYATFGLTTSYTLCSSVFYTTP